jgi:hypothetical protein
VGVRSKFRRRQSGEIPRTSAGAENLSAPCRIGEQTRQSPGKNLGNQLSPSLGLQQFIGVGRNGHDGSSIQRVLGLSYLLPGWKKKGREAFNEVKKIKRATLTFFVDLRDDNYK